MFLKNQKNATNPNSSAWVSASAGSGKTKIIIDRIINLVLNGTSPENILCLTFTKAAAKEMENRLYTKIVNWASMNDKDIYKTLLNIMTTTPSPEMVFLAKNIFNNILNNNQSIKIQTIHSFCEKIIKKLSMKTGLYPHFKVINEIESFSLLKNIHNKKFIDKNINLYFKRFLSEQRTKIVECISLKIINEREKFLKIPEYIYSILEIKHSCKLHWKKKELIKYFSA